ncbi:hypothetical protein Scep_010739 [Stephania cephalantha]|uniref:Protein PEP-RELATED DEVELOPMENT ARRESTED 1, chloroplastic n=1 Tax=Stephania cephalantha TaxID=152367 RepID=A0AAP0JVN2_9MAGN
MANSLAPLSSYSRFISPNRSIPSTSPSKSVSIHSKNQRSSRATIHRAAYEVGGGFPVEELEKKSGEGEKWDSAEYEAILSGGEQVASVMQEMITLLEDMNMDEASEEVAVQLAAQGVIGKRVDEMESGFMMALDYMIQLAERDQDDKRKSLLDVIKETVLSHLAKKCPPHVQVIGLLCRTPQKDSRHELLRRVAAGGGVFKGEKGEKVHLPGANLNDIANQADDLLETMESRPEIPDRKLLARLVLIREEARNMMGGGILDERNDRGLSTLLKQRSTFYIRLVVQRDGVSILKMLVFVLLGEFEEKPNTGDSSDAEIMAWLAMIDARTAIVKSRVPNPSPPTMCIQTLGVVLSLMNLSNFEGYTMVHSLWMKYKILSSSELILDSITFEYTLKSLETFPL